MTKSNQLMVDLEHYTKCNEINSRLASCVTQTLALEMPSDIAGIRRPFSMMSRRQKCDFKSDEQGKS